MKDLVTTTQQPPPSLSNPRQWSPTFVDFVAKCLVKDPASRLSAIDLLSVFLSSLSLSFFFFYFFLFIFIFVFVLFSFSLPLFSLFFSRSFLFSFYLLIPNVASIHWGSWRTGSNNGFNQRLHKNQSWETRKRERKRKIQNHFRRYHNLPSFLISSSPSLFFLFLFFIE